MKRISLLSLLGFFLFSISVNSQTLPQNLELTCTTGYTQKGVFEDGFEYLSEDAIKAAGWTGDISQKDSPYKPNNGKWGISYGANPNTSYKNSATSGTGPDESYDGNYFLMFEANGSSNVAEIISPSVDLSSASFVNSDALLEFKMFAYGRDMGKLEVFASSNKNSFNGDALFVYEGAYQQTSTVASDPWVNVRVSLKDFVGGSVFIKLKYSTLEEGTANLGDMCIDALKVLACVDTNALPILTVTAVSSTKVYGGTDPQFYYTISGFQSGDTEADLDTPISISRIAGEHVGVYAITPSAASDSNYAINFVWADFTITKATLRVTADAATKVYGEADPTLTYSITGFENGDVEADLQSAVAISRANGEDVGVYSITVAGAKDVNYDIDFVGADFEITAKSNPIISTNDTRICQGDSINLEDYVSADSNTALAFYTALDDAQTQNNAIANTIVTPSTSKDFYVVGTNNDNSTSTIESISITVNNNPVISTRYASICEGQSLNLEDYVTAGSTNSLAFYKSLTDAQNQNNPIVNTNVTPNRDINYYVIGTSSENCKSTIETIIITVNRNPIISTNDTSICEGDSIELSGLVTANSATTLVFFNTLIDAQNQNNPIGNTTVTPTIDTDYFVKGTSNDNCLNTIETIKINVNSNPTISTNDISICQGQSLNLEDYVTAGSTTSLAFYKSLTDAQNQNNPIVNTNISPLSTKDYYVIGTSTENCNSTIETIKITFNSNPTISTNDTSICQGQSLSLEDYVTADSSSSLAFYNSLTDAQNQNNPIGNTTVTPNSDINYYVVGTSAENCSSTFETIKITVNKNTSISAVNFTIDLGDSIDLIDLVSSNSSASFVFYNTLSNAQNEISSMSTSVVTPHLTTSYYIVGSSSENCPSTIEKINIIVNRGSATPNTFSYQAILRDSNQKLQANTNVSLKIEILQGGSLAAPSQKVYTENHNTLTNTNGLMTVLIGEGVTNDTFTSIDWRTGPYFIRISSDPNGGNDYSIVGTSQILAVPYAIHAKEASSIEGGIDASYIKNLEQRIQNLETNTNN